MFDSKIKVRKSKYDITKQLSSSVSSAMNRVMEHGQEVALSHKRGSKDKNSIVYEIIKTKDGWKGKLYTNFDYAMFLEYGTGIKAELPHIGHTKAFIESGYRYWFLPKEIADARGREFSPNNLININGNLFYMMFSTQPYPFMRPTAFDLETSAIKIFVDEIKKGLKICMN